MPSDGIGVASSVPWPPLGPSLTSDEPSKLHFWAKGEASFSDFVDTINPLEHLPIISTIYGWIAGKHDIGDLPRIAGDALYGGPWGALSGVFNALLKEETGRDVGEHVVAAILGDTSANAVAATPGSAQPPASAPDPAAAAPMASTGVTPAPSNPAIAPGTASGAPAAGKSAPAPSSPAVPDHPPMPLFRSSTQGGAAAAKAAVPSNAPSSGDPAAKAFLAQSTERARLLYQSTGTPSENGRVLSPQPVALVVPPGSLPNGGRPRLMPVAAAAPVAATPPNPDTPVDVSQKMLDALDKYTALEKQRASRDLGSQVDATP
ncbi:MAG TPA: hypothetical protein VLX09_02275 [Stellaceae bacterium]|nr:hypothetical protein [Stellaceae bacterium]